MSYNPGSASRIATSADVSLNGLSNNQVLAYNTAAAKWINQGLPASAGGFPGVIEFDSYFSGTDDQKIAAMNSFHASAQASSNPIPAIVFDTRQYNFSTAINLVSGMALIGGKLAAAHEYSRSTVFNWQGAAGTAIYHFPGSQANQGYPSDGSPRDISVRYIQHQGGSSTHCIEKNDPSGGAYSGKVLWMSNFRDCGFKNFATVWWGWGDGTTIDGQTHVQACSDTPFFLSGSENNIFGNGYSFMDSNVAGFVSSGKPFIRSTMSKSVIGQVMVTGRKQCYQLSIEGGHNLIVDGFAVDAQDSDPVYGSGIKISGCQGITLSNLSFKGAMSAPASATGGSTANAGWIHMTGGSQLTVLGCNFMRAGTNQAAESAPLLYVGSGVGSNDVKWAFNNYNNYATAATLQQAATGKIVLLADPGVGIITAL